MLTLCRDDVNSKQGDSFTKYVRLQKWGLSDMLEGDKWARRGKISSICTKTSHFRGKTPHIEENFCISRSPSSSREVVAMASHQTEHYQLSQWEAADQVLRTEFNENNVKIDEALAGLAAGLGGKADQTSLNTLAGQMTQKADVSALERVEVTIPKLVTGSYTGDGGEGEEHPCTLDFTDSLGRPPMLVVIRQENGGYTGLILVRGMVESNNHFTNSYLSGSSNTVQWSGNQVTWYAKSSEGQMNDYQTQYRYFAIG